MKTTSLFLAAVSATAISATPLRNGGPSAQVVTSDLNVPPTTPTAIGKLTSEESSSLIFRESIKPGEQNKGTSVAKGDEGMRRRQINSSKLHSRDFLRDLENALKKAPPVFKPPPEVSPQRSGLESNKTPAEVPSAPAKYTNTQYQPPDSMTMPTPAIEPRETHLNKRMNFFDLCGIHL